MLETSPRLRRSPLFHVVARCSHCAPHGTYRMNHEVEAQPQRGDSDNDPDHSDAHGAKNRRVEHTEGPMKKARTAAQPTLLVGC